MRVIALVIFIILAAAGAYGVHRASYLPQLTVNEVRVEGTEQIPASFVKTYVESELADGSYHFIARDNIFIYPKDVLERAVVGFFPRIKSAHVSRASLFAQAITVVVEERSPFAKWCGLDVCYLLDESGFVYTNASSTDAVPSTQYVFHGGVNITKPPIGQTFASTHMPGLVLLLRTLEQDGYAPQSVTVIDDKDFSVTLGRGFALKASYGADPQQLVRDMRLVLGSDKLTGKESELEYVDLRFGNRVYYKLRGEEQAGE